LADNFIESGGFGGWPRQLLKLKPFPSRRPHTVIGQNSRDHLITARSNYVEVWFKAPGLPAARNHQPQRIAKGYRQCLGGIKPLSACARGYL